MDKDYYLFDFSDNELYGYVIALLGGLLGIGIGNFLWRSKKTLTNGQQVNAYSDRDRKHGKNMFYMGLVILPLLVIVRLVILDE